MSLDKFNTTPSPLQVVEKVNDVIDALGTGSFDGYWEAGESVEVGDMRYVEGRDNVGYILECVQAGTTGTTQPTISPDDVGPEESSAINLNDCEGVLGIGKGGTGATTAEQSLTNLGALSNKGGIVDGIFVMNSLAIRGITDNGRIIIQGATSENTGASIHICSLGDPNNSGSIVFSIINDNGQASYFSFSKDGNLYTEKGTMAAVNNGHLVFPNGSEFWIA